MQRGRRAERRSLFEHHYQHTPTMGSSACRNEAQMGVRPNTWHSHMHMMHMNIGGLLFFYSKSKYFLKIFYAAATAERRSLCHSHHGWRVVWEVLWLRAQFYKHADLLLLCGYYMYYFLRVGFIKTNSVTLKVKSNHPLKVTKQFRKKKRAFTTLLV